MGRIRFYPDAPSLSILFSISRVVLRQSSGMDLIGMLVQPSPCYGNNAEQDLTKEEEAYGERFTSEDPE
jgi:hypothetical protein